MPIKYCSDFDETCYEIDEVRCFLGGLWTCPNGYSQEMPLADGICPIMEQKEKELRQHEISKIPVQDL